MLVYGCQELFEARVSTEFENEVNMLSQVEHLNLVKLIGYLEEGDERILVTEFVTNGNLRQHLDGSPYGVILNMGTRLDIAIDIAHALTYLHYYTDRPIIHRDVKSSNILLTDSYRAKVADFGFSRVGPSGEMGATHVSTQVRGTAGYLDPEYLTTYQLNVRSDVYSFGILLIELFTGRRPLDISRPSDERVTVRWAFAKFLDGKLRHILDPNIKRTPAIIGLLPSLFQLAFSCVAPSKTDRPNMIEVQEKLWDIRKDYQAALNHQRENQVERNDHAYSLESVKSPRSGETVKADSAKPRRSEDNESSRARSIRRSEDNESSRAQSSRQSGSETPKNRRNIGSPEAADLCSPRNYTASDALHDRHP
jgi:serine/threonine protein kinase